MANRKLTSYIREARKRGFDDITIRKPLVDNGWPLDEIDVAFAALKEKPQFKNKICIYLDSDIVKIIEKRADKNLMTLAEQIEAIVRKSCANSLKPKLKPEKLDDLLVSLFSRRQR